MQIPSIPTHRVHLGTGTAARRWGGPVALYLAVALLVTLPGLGSTGMVMMEGMVVDTAETMLVTGDYIVPRLYGEIYSYKPPFVYWTTALAMKLAGRAEWAVRLPSALAGIALGLCLLVLVGRLTRPRTGLFAALAAVTGVLFIQKMKIAEFDAPLAAATGIAVAAACHNLAAEPRERSAGLWVIGYLALAAAFLIKGVPALMGFAPGLLVAAAVTRRPRELLSPAHLASALLCSTLIGGYLWLAFDAAGPAVFEQPVAEAQARGFDWSLTTVGRTLFKPFAVWVIFLPWSLVWLWSFRGRAPADDTSSPRVATERRLLKAGWAFLGAGLLTFMAVPTAQTRYYLPLAAGGAIVTALALERLRRAPGRAVHSAFILATMSAAVAIVFALHPEFSSGAPALVLAVGLVGLAAVYRIPQLKRARGIGYLLLVAALCGWAMDTWAVRPRRAAKRDLSPVARALRAELPQRATVWTLGMAVEVGKNASLYHYLDRPVRTFRAADGLPRSGSYLILTPSQLRRLERFVPGAEGELQLIRGVDHPRDRFALYRVPEHSLPDRSEARRASASTLVTGG